MSLRYLSTSDKEVIFDFYSSNTFTIRQLASLYEQLETTIEYIIRERETNDGKKTE
jgi:arsenate reductase-like glutaredoxin family protein